MSNAKRIEFKHTLEIPTRVSSESTEDIVTDKDSCFILKIDDDVYKRFDGPGVHNMYKTHVQDCPVCMDFQTLSFDAQLPMQIREIGFEEGENHSVNPFTEETPTLDSLSKYYNNQNMQYQNMQYKQRRFALQNITYPITIPNAEGVAQDLQESLAVLHNLILNQGTNAVEVSINQAFCYFTQTQADTGEDYEPDPIPQTTTPSSTSTATPNVSVSTSPVNEEYQSEPNEDEDEPTAQTGDVPTEPTEDEPTEPTEDEPTELPVVNEPTEPSEDEPTEPSEDEPTEPPIIFEPTEPSEDEPTEPADDEPTESPVVNEPTEPSEDEQTEQPVVNEPTEPSEDEPTEPSDDEQTEPSEDEPTEQPVIIEPDVTEPSSGGSEQ